MTPKQLADQICEIHKICQEWEDSTPGDLFKRPRWTRWFNLFVGLIGWGVTLGLVWILGKSHVESMFQVHLVIGMMWLVAAVLIAYFAIASGIELFYFRKEWREFASPFSKEDAADVGPLLDFDRRMTKFADPVLGMVATWLESRAKRLENARVFLMGLSTMGTGVFGFVIWPGSPLRAMLAGHLADQWILYLQLWMFAALVGGGMAIVGSWSKAIRSASRALTLRRILANRALYSDLETP